MKPRSSHPIRAILTGAAAALLWLAPCAVGWAQGGTAAPALLPSAEVGSSGLSLETTTAGGVVTEAAPPDARPSATPDASASSPSAEAAELLPTNEPSAAISEAPATSSSEPAESSSTASAPLPTGRGISAVPLKVRGYVRSEFKFNALNLYYDLDDTLGIWTPRGSPYMAFGMLAPASHDAYAEVNAELSFKPFNALSLYGDASLLYSTTAPVQTTFEQVQDLLIGTGELAADMDPDYGVPIPGAAGGQFTRRNRERLVLNELYLTSGIPDWVDLTIGKRRIFWGSAFTWSPLDAINPPRNPLDPTLMREGSYNVTASLIHFENFSLSLLYKPYATEGANGLPESFSFTKNLFAGRLYTNLFETDTNLVAFYNQGRPYAGLSLARYVDVGELSIELHSEMLFQYGRPTWLVRTLDHTGDPYAEYQAPYQLGQLELDDGRIYGDVLLGGTYTFDDSTFLIVEYLRHGAGLTADEYKRHAGFTAYLEEQLPHLASDLSSLDGQIPAEDLADIKQGWIDLLSGAPFLYQEANIRRNYLGITVMKSIMFEWLTPRASVIWNVDDFSATLFPAAEFVLAPNTGGKGTVKMLAGAMIFLGDSSSQASMFPNRFSANLRMTAYY